jgi:hypothetical protein
MYTLCVAVKTFYKFWSRRKYIIFTDSQPNIAAMAKGACNNNLVHRMIKWLFRQQAIHSFNLRLHYINTKENTIADLLSRGYVARVTQTNPYLKYLDPSFPEELESLQLATKIL